MIMLDKTQLKERERAIWSQAASGWRHRDAMLRKGTAPVTDKMLSLTRIQPGSKLLDIASGTGEPAISAAKIVGDKGEVIGTDLVEDMLNVARDKVTNENLNNIHFHCIDAEQLSYPTGYFDAVTIRWGLMFMPAPENCLASAHRSLSKTGRISLACWAEPAKNPFVSVLIKCLAKYMDVPAQPPDMPGIFSFADPNRLRHYLESSGFKNIELEEMSLDVIEVHDGQAYWEAISELAAPVMALVKQLKEVDRSAYIKDVTKAADNMKIGQTLKMKGVTWIASADKV